MEEQKELLRLVHLYERLADTASKGDADALFSRLFLRPIHTINVGAAGAAENASIVASLVWALLDHYAIGLPGRLAEHQMLASIAEPIRRAASKVVACIVPSPEKFLSVAQNFGIPQVIAQGYGRCLLARFFNDKGKPHELDDFIEACVDAFLHVLVHDSEYGASRLRDLAKGLNHGNFLLPRPANVKVSVAGLVERLLFASKKPDSGSSPVLSGLKKIASRLAADAYNRLEGALQARAPNPLPPPDGREKRRGFAITAIRPTNDGRGAERLELFAQLISQIEKFINRSLNKEDAVMELVRNALYARTGLAVRGGTSGRTKEETDAIDSTARSVATSVVAWTLAVAADNRVFAGAIFHFVDASIASLMSRIVADCDEKNCGQELARSMVECTLKSRASEALLKGRGPDPRVPKHVHEMLESILGCVNQTARVDFIHPIAGLMLDIVGTISRIKSGT